MSDISVQVVRIYLKESSKTLDTITHYLHNEAEIKGFSVFRAISGYGDSGELSSSLLDLSLDLPIVIEFFDKKDKVQMALTKLDQLVNPEHILIWDAQLK